MKLKRERAQMMEHSTQEFVTFYEVQDMIVGKWKTDIRGSASVLVDGHTVSRIWRCWRRSKDCFV